MLYECISKDFKDVYFATRNPYTGQEVEENCEKGVVIDGHCYFLDFYIKDINVCIEFDGTFWHKSPRKVKEDAIRDTILSSNGIHVYHVKENDYLEDEQNVIARCLEFIYEHKRKSE
jgi:very-short-patch-repair endonuclease